MKSSLRPSGNEPQPDSDIPSSMEDDVEEIREELVEVVAESDDELIEKYFEEGELSSQEILLGIQGAFRNKVRIVPVLCGSALENIGVQNLMGFVVECFPSPEDVGIIESEDGEVTRDPDISSPMSALVFKTLADPFAGRLTLFRVYSGVLSGDSQVFNSAKGQNEKIGKRQLGMVITHKIKAPYGGDLSIQIDRCGPTIPKPAPALFFDRRAQGMCALFGFIDARLFRCQT